MVPYLYSCKNSSKNSFATHFRRLDVCRRRYCVCAPTSKEPPPLTALGATSGRAGVPLWRSRSTARRQAATLARSAAHRTPRVPMLSLPPAPPPTLPLTSPSTLPPTPPPMPPTKLPPTSPPTLRRRYCFLCCT